MLEQTLGLNDFISKPEDEADIYPDIVVDTEVTGSFGMDIFREIILKSVLNDLVEKYHHQLGQVKIIISRNSEGNNFYGTFNRGKRELWVKVDLSGIERIILSYVHQHPELIDQLGDRYDFELPEEGVQLFGKPGALSLLKPYKMDDILEESDAKKETPSVFSRLKKKIKKIIAPKHAKSDSRIQLPSKGKIGASYRRLHEGIISDWQAGSLSPAITELVDKEKASFKKSFEHELLHLQFFNDRKKFGYTDEDIVRQDELSKKLRMISDPEIDKQRHYYEESIARELPFSELQLRQHQLAQTIVNSFVKTGELSLDQIEDKFVILAQTGLEEVFNLLYLHKIANTPIEDALKELRLFYKSEYSNRTLFPDPKIIDVLEKEGYESALENILDQYKKENVHKLIQPLTSSFHQVA